MGTPCLALQYPTTWHLKVLWTEVSLQGELLCLTWQAAGRGGRGGRFQAAPGLRGSGETAVPVAGVQCG